MTPGSSRRVHAAIVILALTALISNTWFLVRIHFKAGARPVDKVAPYLTRFSDMKGYLPSRGEIGYVWEKPFGPKWEDYKLAQYALAPLVVVTGSEQALVLGNFPHETNPVIPKELTLVRDFGNGVMLFTNSAKR